MENKTLKSEDLQSREESKMNRRNFIKLAGATVILGLGGVGANALVNASNYYKKQNEDISDAATAKAATNVEMAKENHQSIEGTLHKEGNAELLTVPDFSTKNESYRKVRYQKYQIEGMDGDTNTNKKVDAYLEVPKATSVKENTLYTINTVDITGITKEDQRRPEKQTFIYEILDKDNNEVLSL